MVLSFLATDLQEQIEGMKITGLGHVEGWTEGLITASSLTRATIHLAFQDMSSVFFARNFDQDEKEEFGHLWKISRYLASGPGPWQEDALGDWWLQAWPEHRAPSEPNTDVHSQVSTDQNILDIPG